jgi:GNAT superfamily N-acetyltransferase
MKGRVPAVERLPISRAADVAAVFCDAFHAYPVMRFVIGPDPDGLDDRLRKLIEFFVFRRTAQRAPLMGISQDGVLVASATMTLPNEPDMPADVSAKAEALWRDLGDAARARYEAYTVAAKSVGVARPHHHLNMIGVRHAVQGRGLSRPLLEAATQMAADDPNSAGVTLTTELPKNVELYQHFGYRVVGHAVVNDGLQTWGMFREK